jgi:hypothetical protein
MADQFPVFLGDVKAVHDMFPRDEEKMMRSLGGDILDDDDEVVFVDCLCGDGSGDDSAKNAAVHG